MHAELTEYTVWSVGEMGLSTLIRSDLLSSTEKLLDVLLVFARAFPAGWGRNMGSGRYAARKLSVEGTNGGRGESDEVLAHS